MAKKKKPVERVRVPGAKGPVQVKPEVFDWRQFDPAQIEDDGDDSLVVELTTYRDRLEELLKDEGKYVLIKGQDVIGIYDSRDAALREAVARFRDAPALVQRIAATEMV